MDRSVLSLDEHNLDARRVYTRIEGSYFLRIGDACPAVPSDGVESLLRYWMGNKMDSPTTSGLSEASIGIVCALPKELSAVCVVFDCTDRSSCVCADDRRYTLAEVEANGGVRHLVAIALLPEMGNNAAAIRASHLVRDCRNITHILMVGIAGAVPYPENSEHHVRLGDVVVSDRYGVIQYDSVKEADDGSVLYRNSPRPPSRELLDASNWLQSRADLEDRRWEEFIRTACDRLGPAWRRPEPSKDILDDEGEGTISVTHPEDRVRHPGQPRIFHGPIAAANSLQKNYEKRDGLRKQFGVKAIEMEGSGIADAAWDGQIGYLIIRGTCDYCNKNKNDIWQRYAAVAAAAYARALIEVIPATATHPLRPHSSTPKMFYDSDAINPHASESQSNLKYLYERAHDHGRLSERLEQASRSDATIQDRAAVESTMIEGVQRMAPPPGPELARSPVDADLEIQECIQKVRALIATFDHDLAVVASGNLQRLVADPSIILSPLSRKDAYELLTDIEISEFKRRRQSTATAAITDKAFELLDMAKSAGGDDIATDLGLTATEAYIQSLAEGADAGLTRLEGREDSQAIRRKLSILLDAERFQDAAAIVADRPLDKIWCEKAVAAFAQVGDINRAKSAIIWAGKLDDPVYRRRCILHYAESRLFTAFRHREKKEPVIPGSLDEDERAILADVLRELAPVLLVSQGNGRVGDAIEEHAVLLALHSNLLLEDRPAAEEYARLLATRNPVPLVLAQFVLTAKLPCDPDLPRRLRKAHNGAYEASRLALLLEARLSGSAKEAFAEAIKIDFGSLGRDDRTRHLDTLYTLAQELGDDAMKRVEQLALALLAPNLDTIKLFLANRYLNSNLTEAAREILDELGAEDDPRWLQLYGHLMHRLGEPDQAMRRLFEASRRVPEPDLFRQIGQVAYGQKRFDILAEVLKKVVALDPNDVQSRINYAGALIKCGQPKGAAEQFHELRKLDPSNSLHAINEAGALAYAGELDKALAVFDECLRAETPQLEAILGRAETLRLLNRSSEAFRFLDAVRNAWWDEIRFVLIYMSVAHSAGMDEEGGIAISRLIELQRDGRTCGEILKPVGIDDFKKSLARHREHDEEVSQLVLRGQIPWLMVEERRGRVPYLGWAIRTQELSWCPDGTQERVDLSVYATNGFCVVDRVDAGNDLVRKDLVRIDCPDRNTEVTIDQTALFTLHALDLIEAAGCYFGRLLVPATYLGQVLEDRSRLLLHQLSQKTALEQIKSAIDAGTIQVLTGDEGGMAVVNEYVEFAPHGTPVYRLVEIFEPLYGVGRARDAELSRVKQASSGRSLTAGAQIHLSFSHRSSLISSPCRLSLSSTASPRSLPRITCGSPSMPKKRSPTG